MYEFLTTPSGLAQWFADKVDFKEDYCLFSWNGSEEIAVIVDNDTDVFIRYRWDYMENDQFFEFRIEKSGVTGDTILIITDFAEAGDIEDQKLLWDRQIQTLMRQIGS